jgi:RNA-splicing ligase RtcB
MGEVPDHLEYLEGDDAIGYMTDMAFAQLYAEWNRSIIIEQMQKALGIEDEQLEIIQSVHNFIDFNDMTIRKGAIASYVGEKMIIPFNMRDGILIVEGKSNEEFNYSAPHGAGRVLSRSAAKKTLSLEEAKQDMEDAGIFTTNVPLDEAPGAYKDAKVIEEALEPTADIITKIKPIHNIKA